MSDTQDWRTRRWEATHKKIFDTALALFQEHGFERVSVGQIASGAGVSVPTFYAHFPSKEHVVMALPTPEDIHALLATQPADLPVGERIRRAAPIYLGALADTLDTELARWRIIASTPVLRTRAAEFERTTAEMVTQALPSGGGRALTPAEGVIIGAYMSAYTAGLLAWADSNGERKLEETVDEAFDALGNI